MHEDDERALGLDEDESVRDATEDVPESDGPSPAAGETPVDRGGALPPVDAGDDPVDEASEESFPASDPPTYSQIT